MNANSLKRPVALFEPARRRAAEAEYQARRAEYAVVGTALARLRMIVAHDKWVALFDAPLQRPQNDDEPPPRNPPARAATNRAPQSYLQMLDEMRCAPRARLAG